MSAITKAVMAEVQSRAIFYTTGVPAVIGAKLILEDHWANRAYVGKFR
jgi:saccharopine dehydrogenase-like NADP-dependent oxidoreductase